MEAYDVWRAESGAEQRGEERKEEIEMM